MDPQPIVPVPDPGDIFVSYSRVDLPWVDELVKKLEAAGLKVWLDVHKLHPGATWDTEVERALQHAPVLMVILSPDSVKSRNVLDEISFALGKDRLVVPVIYRPCEVPFRVARLQHVDFTSTDEGALGRLIDYLKAAVSGRPAPEPSGPPVPTLPPFGRHRGIPRVPARLLSLVFLPTLILIALAVGASYWRLPTAVTLEVVTRRASFVVRGDEPQDLLNLSPQFSELRVEECGSLSFSATEFADVPAVPAAERVQTPAGAASTRVSFTCHAGSTITLRGADQPHGLVGVLDHVRVVPGATVVLDVYGADEIVLTVDVSTGQALHIPVHTELQIVTDLTDLSEPRMPASISRRLRSGLSTYRARLHEDNHYVDLQTGARTVLVVTPMKESIRDFFRTDSPLPVESLQFLGEALGVDTPTPLRNGTLSYTAFPSIRALEFADQFLVLSRTTDMYIRSLALQPDGLKLTLDGRVVKGAIGSGGPATPGGSRWLDPRLTAFQMFYLGPRSRIVAVGALWLVATVAMWWVIRRRLRHSPTSG